MSKREAMQLALETFESLKRSGLDLIAVNDNIAALKAELAKPEPDQAAWEFGQLEAAQHILEMWKEPWPVSEKRFIDRLEEYVESLK
jgi:hypothetical protein